MNGAIRALRSVACLLIGSIPLLAQADYWFYEDPWYPVRNAFGTSPDEVAAQVCETWYGDLGDPYSYIVFAPPNGNDPLFYVQGRCTINSSQYNFNIHHMCDDNTHWQIDTHCSGDPKPIDPNRGGDCHQMVADPINFTTGNEFQKETDFRGKGQFPLEITRYYNSQSPSYMDTHFGRGWRHGYDFEIVEESTGSVVTKRSTGRTDEWVLSGGIYSSQTMARTKLDRGVEGWQLTTNNGFIETYDSEGRLVSIKNAQGLVQTLLYNQDGSLQSVTDPDGRGVEFGYAEDGRLIEIVDPEGKVYAYTYDKYRRLSGVTFPDDTPLDEQDNPKRQYHYEDSRLFALTGITDENGNREATWEYDEAGRAILNERDGGVDRYTLSYVNDGYTTVTNPLGKQTTYHFGNFSGLLKVTQIEGHPSADCDASSKAYSYFANGTLESKTDWNGNTTSYIRDNLGREISRIEASGTSLARTITTEWHPVFQLPAKITEPGKITEYTYDNQGRLLSRQERAVQ
jgi:YD repeat-containing protein